jgi:hypothetical protein
MGCGWTSGAKPEVMRRVNGIEIVNGDRAEGPLSGWAIWAKMLNAGYHLTAIGGSDEHTADETRDRSIGTPATVVYADELSEPALLDGLRKGRAYVRTRGPQGPTLQFEASSENLTWRVGDTVPKAVTAFTLSASASRATNQQLQWVRNGEIISTSRVVGEQPVTLEVKTQRGEWFSVIIRDENGPTLFSNAIYIEP